jgi:hypothetical protein
LPLIAQALDVKLDRFSHKILYADACIADDSRACVPITSHPHNIADLNYVSLSLLRHPVLLFHCLLSSSPATAARRTGCRSTLGMKLPDNFDEPDNIII